MATLTTVLSVRISNEFNFIHAFVHFLLRSTLESIERQGLSDDAEIKDWTIQGFGMVRFHLDDQYRINIWDMTYRVHNVSDIHTHPWDFDSVVVAGEVLNQRFIDTGFHKPVTKGELIKLGWLLVGHVRIKPGPLGGSLEDLDPTHLVALKPETVPAGSTYSQRADEIHRSLPKHLSITMNERRRVGEDVADVYYDGGQWVNAKPRLATAAELRKTLAEVLALHFKE